MNVEIVTDAFCFDNAKEFGTKYFEQGNVRYARYNDSVRILDLTEALSRGKQCKEVTFNCHGNVFFIFDLFEFYDFDFSKILNAFTEDQEVGEITVYVGFRKSVRVFSPFNLKKIKPLKAKPTKWKIGDVVKALVNGQFTDLKCTGVYSDDYAYDSEINYGVGSIKCPLSFARKLVESPSGWWAYAPSDAENEIHISCYHFDNNSFQFVLNPEEKKGLD